MDYEIQKQLDRIEQETGAEILYACESGSRMWGFASTDSDYDVRFIYAHAKARYLSVSPPNDNMKTAIGNLDIVGWDIYKALRLARNSNPSLLEWMRSPIVYRQPSPIFKTTMADIIANQWSLRSCAHHYFSMAKKNWHGYLCKTVAPCLKKYLYCIRPCLCAIHILETKTLPPILFEDLLNSTTGIEGIPTPTRTDIYDLLERKRKGGEVTTGPRITRLDALIVTAFVRASQVSLDLPHRRVGDELLDALLTELLEEDSTDE